MSEPTRYRPTRTPAWAVRMQKLAPGVYADDQRAIHISEAEICEAFGVMYTKANSKLIGELVEQMRREQFPDTPPTERVMEDEDTRAP